ncbi:hypothetical protein IGB42_03486 [Andreprevotia sp. IGB-42]|uniref:hypothetical protein n=1 Tax=Andreprevotia sp. IGB-42 TaxID=2497473 RepID=UPI001357A408|nr:hypothetical protein [Andreprevotia sp. IGB-42]KAF0811944.1 hypothetical protein IGB42_03486 [Andreprevotia sp. IGB-42]
MRDDRNDLIQILGMFAIRLAIAAALLYFAYKRDLTLLPFAGAAAAFLMAKPLLEIGPALFGRLKVATYKDADH